jgi:hypothetical protein
MKLKKLIESTHEMAGHVLAAKNIRIELANAFPRTKFSVTSKSYSMGDSVSVNWTDGPTTKKVDAIVNKYVAGSFDGMTDSYTYHSGDRRHGTAKYIHTNRHQSDTAVAKAIEELKTEHPNPKDPAPSLEEFKNGEARNTTPIDNTNGSHHWSWQSIIYRHLEGLGDYGV